MYQSPRLVGGVWGASHWKELRCVPMQQSLALPSPNDPRGLDTIVSKRVAGGTRVSVVPARRLLTALFFGGWMAAES